MYQEIMTIHGTVNLPYTALPKAPLGKYSLS